MPQNTQNLPINLHNYPYLILDFHFYITSLSPHLLFDNPGHPTPSTIEGTYPLKKQLL